MTAAVGFPDDVRHRIRGAYLALLTERRSPLLADRRLEPQLVAQLDSILDAIAPELRWQVPRPAGLSVSADIGTARARSGTSPAQSLKAAALIFEAALPEVAQRLVHLGDPRAEARAALLLNAAILDRMSAAAVSYVEVLLSAAQTNAHVQRLRLSRELHDEVAPTVALALQALELHDVYRADQPARANAKLDAAQTLLREALMQQRRTAGEMRDDVAAAGLAEALRRYVDSVSGGPQVLLMLDEPERLDQLSAAYCEETFLIVREAIRNAVSHAEARIVRVAVAVDVDDRVLRATVSDDGRGFDVDAAERSDGVGLASMRERAEILSGTVEVDARPGAGCAMRLLLPLSPRTSAEAVR